MTYEFSNMCIFINYHFKWCIRNNLKSLFLLVKYTATFEFCQDNSTKKLVLKILLILLFFMDHNNIGKSFDLT
ncbi:hypothetical protein BpHYR1_053798 [Brachionus plicatilis]|uniref:Uncharacterized protein n=1 Tax=Brachionus plicatilis TaxID=10195 RepID=A0A3M7TB88_BRAPC|nr:hypothetical protein BpHYR1_053798 [Brachionus plicatilis]